MTLIQKHLFAAALFLVVLGGVVLVGLVWRRRAMPCAWSFLAVVLMGAVWALADALNLLFPGYFWVTMAFVGVSGLPVGWLAFCMDFTGRGGWLQMRRLLVLCVIPALTIPVVATNEMHHWMWENVRVGGGIRVVYGFWHVLAAGYGYLLFGWGYVLLLFNLHETQGGQRRRLVLVLVAGLVPWVANLLQIADVYPRVAPNPTPLAFMVSCVAFFLGLFRFELLEILPVVQRVVIGQMPDALLVMDAQDRMVSVNPATEKLLGVQGKEWVGRPLAELLARWPGSGPLLAARDGSQVEISWNHAGSERFFDVRSGDLRDGRGRRLGRFLVARDVTVSKEKTAERERLLRDVQAANDRLREEMAERQRVAQELRRAEESWRVFCETSPVGIYRTTPDGRILMANPAVLQMLGYGTLQELVEQNLEGDGYEPGYERSRFKEVLDREGRVGGWEARWRRRDGAFLWVRENAHVVRDESGVVLYYDGTLEDISAEKDAEQKREELEQRMQQLQKLESLGVLAGGIAHDFNNLLMVIQGHADLAAEDAGVGSPVEGEMLEIREHVRRASELCQKMLAYAGQAPVAVGPVQLEALVQDISPLLRSSNVGKGTLRLKLAPGLPCIRGSAPQLQQVVLSLVTNAAEASAESGGEVLVAVGCTVFSREQIQEFLLGDHLGKGRYVWLQVTDHGCGMEAGTRERMFEPFFTTKFAGRGLGLSAVLGIVRSHHGAIQVNSEKGKGTVVRVAFPAV